MLKFYQVEFDTFRYEWEVGVSQGECSRLFGLIMRRYKIRGCNIVFSPTVVEGEYDPDTGVVYLCLKPSLGLLVHEAAHAVEDHACRDGTFHRKRLLELIADLHDFVRSIR